MNVTHRLSRLLAMVGLDLNRCQYPKIQQKNVPKTSGMLVELFGVSGVGKSHLYRMLSRDLKIEWHLRSPLFAHVKADDGFSYLDEDEAELIGALLKWKCVDIFSQSRPLSRNVRLYDFYLKFMSADIIARKKLLPSCGVFLDDSLTRHFSDELLRWHDQNDSDKNYVLTRFLGGRCIILMDAPDEYIVKNLKRRHQETRGKLDNDLLAFMDVESVMDRMRMKRNSVYQCFDFVTSCGLPTLKLDASDETKVNMRKIRVFLESIIR
ncbi:hypothetical protein [Halomonas alkalicola]|uniref:hypothetical protein n=1 Tax=Halomonas alkalicola TaxID=1930622 RepID=UPI00265FDE25|nr:hypothetical protein [Halomonas alkalicola]